MDFTSIDKFLRENALGIFIISTASSVVASLIYALVAGSGASAEKLGGSREYRVQRAYALMNRVARLEAILDPKRVGQILLIPLAYGYWKAGADTAERTAASVGLGGWTGEWWSPILHFFIFCGIVQIPFHTPSIITWGERRRLEKWLFLMPEEEVDELHARLERAKPEKRLRGRASIQRSRSS